MLIKFKQNNAKVVMPGQGGTPVPNEGTLSEVYFNTALSVDEVVSELRKLTYDPDIDYMNLLLTDKKTTLIIATINYNESLDDEICMISNAFNNTHYFVNEAGKQAANLDFVGWNPALFTNTNKIEFTSAINLATEMPYKSAMAPAGADNDKIANLFSTTPNFGEGGSGESYPLSGDYDGSAIAVAGKLNAGTPVPNDGSFVEYLYFNTDLSMEEVDAILDTIEFHPAKNPGRELPNYHYLGYADADGNGVSAIGMTKYDDGYAIAAIDAAQNIVFNIYNSSETYKEQINLIGWHTPFGMPILTNKTTISETMDGTPIGEQNDKLDGLISIAPFNKSEIVIDMKKLLESGKLPLSINVTIEK